MNQAAAREAPSPVAMKVKGEREQRRKEKPERGGNELNALETAEGLRAGLP
jgi:hypothetical protein